MWEKEKIARYEQFLLFPQCFQKICTADTEKPGLVWERVKKNREKFKAYLLTLNLPNEGMDQFCGECSRRPACTYV